ncbi:VapC ribonuclease Y4jK [Candidatus Sulfopaludibacter sp. SbA3]|nr:VapC ribonuclease Y4jK [Candidatus Sulfopaludibacter sp. SbA3]
MIILDTNILSEATRPEPASEVVDWLAGNPTSSLFTTVITQAEILYGVEIMPTGKRRTALGAAAKSMFEKDFAGRILPFDTDAARLFPGIVASRRASGRPIPLWDGLIAAIALSHGATLATRNTKDFEGCGVSLFNPWKAPRT